MAHHRPGIAVLCGPTASGKTDLAIVLARRMDAEIISADSVQVYERLDIGSAKPTCEQMSLVPHHMIGVIPLSGWDFSVAAYQQMAFACIDDVLSRGKLPLIVGGTGLYIRALTDVMEFSQTGSDDAFRRMWAQRIEEEPGSDYRALQRIDLAAAQRLHPNDTKRVVRALEVFHVSGQTMTQRNERLNGRSPKYRSAMVGITMPRSSLYERIDQRVDMMMSEGLLSEVLDILHDGFDVSAPSLQGLGYKELIAAVQSCEERHSSEAIGRAVAQIKLGTRHFAKRQMTWFKRDKRITWLDRTEFASVEEAAEAAQKEIERQFAAFGTEDGAGAAP